MNNEKIIDVSVFGRVQGVNFRNNVLNVAKSLRLKGFVENIEDGSVHILAVGSEGSLLELLKWCQQGSMLSKVEGMNYKWLEDNQKTSEFDNFSIKKQGPFLKDQVKSFLNLGKKISADIISPAKLELPRPQHIVIIPDGNRRWAKGQGLKPWEAYWHVQNKIDDLLDGVKKFNVKHFTLWGFSTENWNRGDKEEIDQLMKVFESTIDKFHKRFHEDKARFRHLGRKDRLPEKLIKKLQVLERETENYDTWSVNVALDYGGRDEMIRAIENIVKSGKTKIDEQIISEALDTHGLPDPDLIIRTSGEKRLSGMMPWQAVYSEFYFTNVYFPDFGIDNLEEAIIDFGMRKRNFGS
ncbi:di-trans,poly-cis-decaprenylcistransferase [Candidatus Dojkabacteria bacterium]|nr:di-trans,poly-cis-decaprenylcistransferase [Candidatus Dojkabacteria bacterium]